MFFGIILSRVLFIACMVFILGYVFGNFSKSRTLTRITKVASVLAIALFIVGNIFLLRSGGWRHGNYNLRSNCHVSQQDSTINR
jgi:hypothetical protein